MRIYQTGNSAQPALATPSTMPSHLLPVSCGEGQTGPLEHLLSQLHQLDPDQSAPGAAISGKLASLISYDATPFPVPDRLLAPVLQPSKIFCVGRNYAEHAAETGADLPTEPLIFSKMPTTLIGHGYEILLPPESQQVDFEAELVVVIGRAGSRIPREQALQYVAGYTCGNDVTARDWQKNKPGQQWLLGKSFDSFAPLGPCFVSADAIPDPQVLDIQLRLNGQIMQQANTRDMIFPIDELISYVSQVCTLLPGDLLFTGTPSGVGVARDPAIFLQPGDRVEVEIEQIGCLANVCKAVSPTA